MTKAASRMQITAAVVVLSPCGEASSTPTRRCSGRDAVVGATPGHVDTVRRHVLDALTPSQVRQLGHMGDALGSRLRRVAQRG